jgi:hypothetical protein
MGSSKEIAGSSKTPINEIEDESEEEVYEVEKLMAHRRSQHKVHYESRKTCVDFH